MTRGTQLLEKVGMLWQEVPSTQTCMAPCCGPVGPTMANCWLSVLIVAAAVAEVVDIVVPPHAVREWCPVHAPV